MRRLASMVCSGWLATLLTAIGCGGDEGPRVIGPGVSAGASGAGEQPGSAGSGEAAQGGAAAGSEAATGASESEACETGRERCRCFNNGTCYGSLSCLSDHCVDTGEGGAGGSAGTTLGTQQGGGNPAAGGNPVGGSGQAGSGGIPSTQPAAGEGPGGVAGAIAGGSGLPPGTGGTAGSGGAGAAGTAGAAGAAGSPCVQLLTTEAAFTQATSSLTVVTEDFALTADGAAVTDFAVAYGNGFYRHDEVKFESFATSDQAEPGTRSEYIVTSRGDGISSMIGSYNGYDGIAMLFAAPQMAVGFSVSAVGGTEGFSMSVLDADGGVVAELPVPASAPYFAAVQSTCGAVIDALEIAPNRSETGGHHSQYWEMAWVKFAH